MWWLLSLACSPDGVDPCSPDAAPGLTIGYGVAGYTPIDDGGELPLVHGPQGGYHLEIGLLARGIDTSDLVIGHLEGAIGGETYASEDPWLDFRCDEDAGGLVAWGARLVYASTPEFLDGKETTVVARVDDPTGESVDARATFTIRDDP